jgi:hypothetical protein
MRVLYALASLARAELVRAEGAVRGLGAVSPQIRGRCFAPLRRKTACAHDAVGVIELNRVGRDAPPPQKIEPKWNSNTNHTVLNNL